jgi:hypothetical protein
MRQRGEVTFVEILKSMIDAAERTADPSYASRAPAAA